MSQLFRINFYPLIFFIISSLFWIFTIGYALLQQAYFLGTILTISGITLWFGELQKHKVRIELTEQTISVISPKDRFQIMWTEILMARRIKQAHRSDRIELATREHLFYLSLGLFEAERVWKQIEARISPAALAKEAYKFLPVYQRRIREGERVIRNLKTPLQAGYDGTAKTVSLLMLAIYVLIGVFGIAFFANTELWLAGWACFSPPLLIGLWVVIGAIFLRLEMTPEKIALINLWQRQELHWDEMKQIKVDRQGRKLLFCGANRCLAILYPQALSDKPKEQMVMVLTAQIEHHRIKVETDELNA